MPTIKRAPTRFRVSLRAEGCLFNDILYIDGKPVLHIVDEGTRFSAERFLLDVSTKTIFLIFLIFWAAIYTTFPHKILFHQGTAFGGMFKTAGALLHVEIEEPLANSYSSLGRDERYHDPLRTTYRKLKVVYRDVSPEFMLSCSS